MARFREYAGSRHDLNWLYVAYRKGAFDIPEGLDEAGFAETVAEIFEYTDGAWLLYGHLNRGETPIGFVYATVKEHRMEPHVFWFPWATPRSMLEGAAAFLNAMSRSHLLLIVTNSVTEHFYRTLSEYDLLKEVGRIESFWETESGVLFQTVF